MVRENTLANHSCNAVIRTLGLPLRAKPTWPFLACQLQFEQVGAGGWCRYVTVRNITQADVIDLHAEILSVFDADNIITPDQLRGNASSLKEALISDGSRWASHPAIIPKNTLASCAVAGLEGSSGCIGGRPGPIRRSARPALASVPVSSPVPAPEPAATEPLYVCRKMHQPSLIPVPGSTLRALTASEYPAGEPAGKHLVTRQRYSSRCELLLPPNKAADLVGHLCRSTGSQESAVASERWWRWRGAQGLAAGGRHAGQGAFRGHQYVHEEVLGTVPRPAWRPDVRV